MLDDFNEMDIGELRNKDGELTTLGQYLNLWNQGEETIVNAPLIRQQMAGIQFPIYFYDYETVTSPVPLFQ